MTPDAMATLGDFGAGDPRSDAQIDKQEAPV